MVGDYIAARSARWRSADRASVRELRIATQRRRAPIGNVAVARRRRRSRATARVLALTTAVRRRRRLQQPTFWFWT